MTAQSRDREKRRKARARKTQCEAYPAKIGYATWGDANRVGLSRQARGLAPSTLEPYHCPSCGRFHLTSHPRRLERA